MAKRRRDTLTGGTGDVKPQYLTASTGTPGAIDDYTVAQINLPNPRFTGQEKDTATVFEVLSVDWFLGLEDAADFNVTHWGYLATVTQRSFGDVSTLVTMAEDAQDPLSIAMAFNHRGILTTGATNEQGPLHVDTTDGDGNGVLIATDRIFIVAGNVGGTSVARAVAKIKYRLTNVGVMEYIGIVQSQQG